MLKNSRFDDLFEALSRRVASRTSRRGFIGRVGAVAAGVAVSPLLPVDRRGRVSRAEAGPEPAPPRVMSCFGWPNGVNHR